MVRTLLLALAFAVIGQAQECKLYFGVVPLDSLRSNGGTWPEQVGMWPDPQDAKTWWLKNGVKKYKTVCYTTEREKTDFILAWTFSFGKKNADLPSDGHKTGGRVQIGFVTTTYDFRIYDRRNGQEKLDPIYSVQRVAAWRGSADKSAFEEAVKFLGKNTP